MPIAGKSGIIEEHPNPQTILFAGRYINQSAISRTQGIDQSYLSRIFAGRRTPSLKTAMKIAAVLGMTLDELMIGLEERGKQVREDEARLMRNYQSRLDGEVRADLRTISEGGIPAPRIPLSA